MGPEQSRRRHHQRRSQPHQHRSRWRHLATLDRRSCCSVDGKTIFQLFWSSSKQEHTHWDSPIVFWTKSRRRLERTGRRTTSVKTGRRKKPTWRNFSTWSGASWFNVWTRVASTSSEGTSRMGLQRGQPWPNSTNQRSDLGFSLRCLN